jgi:hypothetical protein
MRDVYLPVVRHLFPTSLWKHRGLELTGSFDCAVRLPMAVDVSNTIGGVKKDYGVVVWKP